MVTEEFGPGHFTVEVATHTNIAMTGVRIGAIDVHGDGQRWNFQDGKVIIDFKARTVREELGATLCYRVLYKGRELLAVYGSPEQRGHRGGRRLRPGAYNF